MGNKAKSLKTEKMVIMGDGSDVIAWFRGRYDFLSNFYPCRVSYAGDGETEPITYANSEAAFQAQKSKVINERAEFSAITAKEAKAKGKKVTPFDSGEWNGIRDAVMEEVVRAKFTQNEDLRAMLLETGDCYLIEGTTWDYYWGARVKNITDDNGNKIGQEYTGQNKLGKILMKIRSELRVQP